MQTLNFPFTAVVGQKIFKLALILATINPAIGGVLISGPRGSAKSTLARSLADIAVDIVPAREGVEGNSEGDSKGDGGNIETSDYPFVTLPLGASEDRLTGTLDLQQVLSEQQVNFQPGLLAKADGGALYVDEVNLLPDTLVDLLLDVAASGRNIVERDGISHQHDAQFLLLGTMNPDEGELRPQLQDRFGLAVMLDNQTSVQERVEIVQLREAFDRDPQAFLKQYAQQQADLRQHIAAAITQLPNITCSTAMRTVIAERCLAANVDGVRADIVWYRAAVAHAAWRLSQSGVDGGDMDSCDMDKGELAVSEQDILAVEELVLAHRRQSMPPSQGSGGSGQPHHSQDQKGDNQRGNDQQNKDQQNKQSSSPFRRPQESYRQSEELSSEGAGDKTDDDKSTDSNSGQSPLSDWGQMSPQNMVAATEQYTLPISTLTTAKQTSYRRLGHTIYSSVARHMAKAHTALGSSNNSKARSAYQYTGQQTIDWFSTLVSHLGQWPLRHLQYRKTKTTRPVLHLILLDTSASTLQGQLLSHTKAVVEGIAQQAYLHREQLSVMGFGNQQVRTLMAPQKSPKILRQWLDAITAGGGTPLQAVLEQALVFQKKLYRQSPEINVRTYLITDGRTTQSFADQYLLGEVLVIDAEHSAIKRGKAREIANVLAADYFPLFA